VSKGSTTTHSSTFLRQLVVELVRIGAF